MYSSSAVTSLYPKLSPGEFETLKVLWELGEGTVSEVRDAHNTSLRPKPAYTTTMTVLGRLVDKNAATVDKDKQPFRYRPARQRTSELKRRLGEFVAICYENEPELLLRHLLDEGYLSESSVRAFLMEEE